MTDIRYPDQRYVGESYRDYAARMAGAARAAEKDRDAALAEVQRLRARVAELEAQPRLVPLDESEDDW